MLVTFFLEFFNISHQGGSYGIDPLGIRALDLVGTENVPQLAHQHVGLLNTFLLKGQQLHLGTVVQVLYQTNKQIGRIVQRLSMLRPDQDHRQGIALVGLERRHLTGIKGARQIAKLFEFGNGYIWLG